MRRTSNTTYILIAFSFLVCLAKQTCLSYASATHCSICSTGYYLATDFSCKKCPIGCTQCANMLNCFDCAGGYYQQDNICQQCTQNCFQCDNSTNCTDCILGYQLTATAKCSKCSDYCIECNEEGCQTCSSGFGINIDSKECYICGGLCLNCQSSINSTTQCLNCPEGYYLNESNCIQCSSDCKKCQRIFGKCLSCFPSHYISTEGTCEVCSQNCQKCANETFCEGCFLSYFLDVDNTSNKICESCIANCLVCQNSEECQNCSKGLYLSQGTCHLCGDACLTCLGESACTMCSEEYFNDEGACKLCPSNCSSCSNKTHCQECISTVYALSNGQCSFCSEKLEGCVTCLNPTFCRSCERDYYLLDGVCYDNYQGLATGWIVLIVLASIAVAVLIGYCAWVLWRRRKGFMGEAGGNSENNGLRASYYEIP